MLFITPLILILAFFVMWLFVKSVSRFKSEYFWYKRSRRQTTSRVCRTTANQQQRNCANQPPVQLQTCPPPADQQFYYVRPQNPHHQMPTVMEVAIPCNYYGHPGMSFQYFEPPPVYPGYMPNSETMRYEPSTTFPSAPPLPIEK
ncbi:hypothetical protein M3Y97_00409500 [Aphelenchoides bicaudatus]|nr:hypothetical protein M3Y97_00409500 [Aphelenchoides bicaudatus]